MGRRKRTIFDDSAALNNATYRYYLDRLMELSISMFEYEGLPDTVDSRYIELKLFESGRVVYFMDEVVGDLCLDCLPAGNLSVYGEPIYRRAFSAYNNYQRQLTESDSVIIWNNLLRQNSIYPCILFAKKLANLDRIIDVNANAQKTPVLVQGTEKQKLTLTNVYKEFDGNAPIIFGDSSLDLNALKAISTQAPYVSDKIYELKTQIWNEALTYLGISNVNLQKKERMITDEVTRNLGGTIASRYSRMDARQKGFDKVNKMFGTNIEVKYRETSEDLAEEFMSDDLDGGEGNE